MHEIIERLNNMLLDNFEPAQIEKIDAFMQIILYDYDISRKSTSVTVYNGDTNDRLIKKFLATKMVKGCSHRTIQMYSQALFQFKNKIEKNLIDITSDDILFYFAIRNTRDNVSAVTQDNELRVLRTFYNYLTVEEIIDKNPTLKIDKIKSTKKVKVAFTDEELERLRIGCQTRKGVNLKHLCILEMLISTGCRACEISEMKIENIDGDRIKVHGKGNKERWVYINARCKIALENYMKVRNSDSPYIFPGEMISTKKETEKMVPESINGIVKSIAKRAGVPNVHAHKFRRTAATMALRRGMPIELVSKMLGHEQLTTTQIYLELTEDDLANAHRKYC